MFTYLPPIPFAILAFTASAVLMFYIFRGWGKYSRNIMIILYCSVFSGVLSGVHKLVMTYSNNEIFKSILSIIQITATFVIIGIIIFAAYKEAKTNPKASMKRFVIGFVIVAFSASSLAIMLFLSWLLK